MSFGISAWLGVYFVLLMSATGIGRLDCWVTMEKGGLTEQQWLSSRPGQNVPVRWFSLLPLSCNNIQLSYSALSFSLCVSPSLHPLSLFFICFLFCKKLELNLIPKVSFTFKLSRTYMFVKGCYTVVYNFK